MLVVADISPLRYLVEIDCEHVLPALFTRVAMPQAVLRELQRDRTPSIVRNWTTALPEWIEVREVNTPPDDLLSAALDPGECEAIQLAGELGAHLILIDERDGFRVARQRGFQVLGTLGVLVEASAAGLLSIGVALTRLAMTSFRRNPRLFEQVRQLAAKRLRA